MKTKISTGALIIFMFFYPLIANAGWLTGPKNFDDCVLEKMKGQDKAMIHHARSACRELFPSDSVEKEIPMDEYSKIKTTWRQYGSTIEMIIKENLSNYNISKIKAGFSIKRCSEIENAGWIYTTNNRLVSQDYTLYKEFSFKDKNTSKLKKIFASENWETTSVVKIRDNQTYNCMGRAVIWGYLKK